MTVDDGICKSTITNTNSTFTIGADNLGKGVVARLLDGFTTLNVSQVSDDFIGATITVRNTVSRSGKINVVANGVTFSPSLDTVNLNFTAGNTLVFMYVGNNTYDVYGG